VLHLRRQDMAGGRSIRRGGWRSWGLAMPRWSGLSRPSRRTRRFCRGRRSWQIIRVRQSHRRIDEQYRCGPREALVGAHMSIAAKGRVTLTRLLARRPSASPSRRSLDFGDVAPRSMITDTVSLEQTPGAFEG